MADDTVGQEGVMFRVAERGTVTVRGGVLTWTPTGAGPSLAAELFPLGEE
jgi:hypothetical protein